MAKNDFGMKIVGLKCDNPTCDYRDDNIQVGDYEKYINAPCPKCGAPLLTQADYDVVMKMMRVMKNPLIRLLGKVMRKAAPEEADKVYHATMNGTGWDGMKLTRDDGGLELEGHDIEPAIESFNALLNGKKRK
jgi:hypothetical protein